MATSRLGALIDRYRAAHGASESELARRIGVTRENLRKWRTHGTRRLPDHANLVATARVIGRPYREVLSAALFDTGYLDGSADAPRPYNEVLADAIAVLTEATRLTNQLSRRNDTGQWETDPDPSASVPIDWAEFVTLAVAGAAANVGSAEEALAGRPGSWEADRVRQMLQATAFDDKDLLRHRTDSDRAVILGKDRHDANRWEQFEHFAVTGVRKWPVFDNAGMAGHLDDESVIVSGRRAESHSGLCHRQIVAEVPCCTHIDF